MSRPQPNADGMYRIIWPDKKLVDAEQLMNWATDDANEVNDTGHRVTDINEAIDILLETGSVTFASKA